MAKGPTPCPHSDVSLLLRAHAEQRWLHREVLPVLVQLEAPDAVEGDQLAAALAYLEVMWMEAGLRAWESDATHAHLVMLSEHGAELSDHACRYFAAVRQLREAVAARVARVLSQDLAGGPGGGPWHGPWGREHVELPQLPG